MATENWRVLLVDDENGDRLAVRWALTTAAPGIRLDEVERAAQVHSRLAPPGDAYDCLLVDCYLPDATGVELITALRARGVQTPILAVTSHGDDALEDAVLTAGASDYLPKPDWRPDRLIRRLRHAIRIGRSEARYAAALTAAKRASQDRDELLSIVSHDLRSPLNAIRMAADELIDPSLPEDERKTMVTAVQRSLRRADRLIGDLLDFSRIETGGLMLSCDALSVKELLKQGCNAHLLVARANGLELQVEADPNVGLVLADRERILQVLANLLDNAVRHARDSGVVTLAAQPAQDMVALSVTDRGPGIAAEKLPYLFDRVSQAPQHYRTPGGLGLFIAKGIVTAHGGTISATSTRGAGSRFSFTLPRAY